MEIYLDNAATTRVCPEAADAAYKVMTEVYGNPGSTHKLGREADDGNWLLMHAAGANVAGQIASVIAGGLIIALVH